MPPTAEEMAFRTRELAAQGAVVPHMAGLVRPEAIAIVQTLAARRIAADPSLDPAKVVQAIVTESPIFKIGFDPTPGDPPPAAIRHTDAQAIPSGSAIAAALQDRARAVDAEVQKRYAAQRAGQPKDPALPYKQGGPTNQRPGEG